jgi:hypothetical protein
MLPESTRKDILVNYDQQVKALYIKIAVRIILSNKRLDVIRESIHYPPYRSPLGVPSWCPDWSHSPEISALPAHSFSAAGETVADFEFHNNNRELEFSALQLGHIDVCGIGVGTLPTRMHETLMAFVNWRAILLDYTSSREDITDDIQEAFCSVLSLGQVPRRFRDDEGGWRAPCYQVFACMLKRYLPRLILDADLEDFSRKDIIRPDEWHDFLQTEFRDRMVRL